MKDEPTQLELLGLDMKNCLLCGNTENIEEHHIDWNHNNNTSGNRIPLCKTCHVWLHKAGYLTIDELKNIRKEVFQLARFELLRLLRRIYNNAVLPS